MKKNIKKLCLLLAFISILQFSNGFIDLKMPFNYYWTSVCSTSEISPHSDIPPKPVNES